MEVAAALARALASGSITALPLALAGGVLAGLNPCCLALYPAAAATCCAVQQEHQPARRALSSALAFVVGVALATSTLGILAAAAGRVTGLAQPLRYLVAVIPLLMGLHFLGWLHIPMERFSPKLRSGMGGAFGTGFMLALVIGPCSTPLLASVLAYAAYQGSLPYGGMLLFFYGLGAATPVLLAGTATGALAQNFRAWRWLNTAIGISLIALGFYLIWIA